MSWSCNRDVGGGGPRFTTAVVQSSILSALCGLLDVARATSLSQSQGWCGIGVRKRLTKWRPIKLQCNPHTNSEQQLLHKQTLCSSKAHRAQAPRRSRVWWTWQQFGSRRQESFTSAAQEQKGTTMKKAKVCFSFSVVLNKHTHVYMINFDLKIPRSTPESSNPALTALQSD